MITHKSMKKITFLVGNGSNEPLTNLNNIVRKLFLYTCILRMFGELRLKSFSMNMFHKISLNPYHKQSRSSVTVCKKECWFLSL
jgi:hypothetical protein